MGFNTVAVIHNDFFDEIQKSGPLGARIAAAILSFPPRRPEDAYFGAGKIISMAHADQWQVTVVGTNTGYIVGDTKGELPPEVLEAVAKSLERHGYTVQRTPGGG